MTIEERIESAKAKIEKLQKTMERHHVKLTKKEAKFAKDNDENTKWEIEWCKEDIEKTEEKIREAKENRRASTNLVENLITRIKEKAGEVIDYKGLYVTMGNGYEGVVINGTVIGYKGTAVVESIRAGGYNIQRLHIRTLVK